MIAVAAAREERVAYFAMLGDGEHPLELRCYRPDGAGWPKHFHRDPAGLDELAHRLTTAGEDVYVGMAPRQGTTRQLSRRYLPLRALFVDCDDARACRKLELFEPQPTAVILSGGRDGDVPNRYGVWALERPLPIERAKRELRRLAYHLEACAGSAEPAHILRAPGSRSHKNGRTARLVSFTGEVYALDELTGDLPDPPAPARPPRSSRAARTVPVGERRAALISLLGSMRRWGAGDKVLAAATRAFCEHQCAHDPSKPLDLAHALAAARDVADRYPAGPAQPWGAWKEPCP